MKTSFQKSSNAELSGITLGVLDVTDQSTVEGIQNNPLVTALRTTHAPFHQVVLREATVGLGPELRRLNRRRIKMPNALRSMLRQLTKFSNTARADAAAAILAGWDKLINPTSGNDYDEVNAYMSKLIALLKSDAVKPHFTLLMLTDAVDDVERADTDFRTIYMEQTKGNAELRLQGSATQHRPPVEKALSNYLKFVTALREQPGYDVLYSNLNEAIRTARKVTTKPAPEEEGAV